MKRALKKLVFVEPKSTHLHIYSRVCIPRLGSVLLGTLMRNQGYDVRVYIEDIEARRGSSTPTSSSAARASSPSRSSSTPFSAATASRRS